MNFTMSGLSLHIMTRPGKNKNRDVTTRLRPCFFIFSIFYCHWGHSRNVTTSCNKFVDIVDETGDERIFEMMR